jgi:hypothetical protein
MVEPELLEAVDRAMAWAEADTDTGGTGY